ncbi:peptidoglycan DD-metalloendopeptidase family protein [Leucobacter sp. UT-8R-CII-1-4]|uniref:peptidoglycan DD-metalloendopeptidase family protein n=1 Tax=Leucobacter sp. UT-8R-CII-1-4 TaxID=3040075 RepID=UPI0024A99C52|nr:peptidoglycan DD-metalloendopeptidase family protein [Leucobacter sp. UT-8R-CII-1-4]MDI6023884.1 peptidoglycan DD-metalloendopeptidase family protein [Leucobacter sp. UT-8R-CII-1-4]
MTTRSSSPAKRAKNWSTVLAATALVALVSMPLTTATEAAAVDASLPTWQDVQNAKDNQAATAGKIKEIEALLVQVNQEVENTKKELEAAISASAIAEEELLKANTRLDELNVKLAESTEEADSASQEAAALVGLMYRSGGIDRSTEMFLESDAETSDELLERLASMSKATERNSKIAEDATRAKNDAQSLGDQADVVSQERERLREDAEARKNTASTLAAAAMEKQQTQEAQRDTLDAQLAALKDTTATTVAGYEERLAQEAEDRRKEQENNNNNGGGQGPGPGGQGWGLPIYSYWVSEEFGGGRGHGGIDLAAPMWTPIYAAAAGTVTACYEFSNYGNTVDITHPDGSMTRYAHQPYGGITVNCGQWVNQGQRIGNVGSTGWSSGPHLHFETWPTSGYRVNPRGFMADRGVWF